jgi:hypothetical protein
MEKKRKILISLNSDDVNRLERLRDGYNMSTVISTAIRNEYQRRWPDEYNMKIPISGNDI